MLHWAKIYVPCNNFENKTTTFTSNIWFLANKAKCNVNIAMGVVNSGERPAVQCVG